MRRRKRCMGGEQLRRGLVKPSLPCATLAPGGLLYLHVPILYTYVYNVSAAIKRRKKVSQQQTNGITERATLSTQRNI